MAAVKRYLESRGKLILKERPAKRDAPKKTAKINKISKDTFSKL